MKKPKGLGSVVKHGAKFRARLIKNGKPEFGPTRETYAEADRDRLALIASPRPSPAPQQPPSLRDWAYLQSSTYYQTKAPNTLATHETYRLLFIETLPWTAKPLDQITRDEISAWLTSLQAERRTRITLPDGAKAWQVTHQPASPPYKHRIRAYVRRLFSLAIEAGHIESNPADKIHLPAIKERKNTTLTKDQLQSVIGLTDRTAAIVQLCACCGLSPSEARLLTWPQLDRANLQILHPGAKTPARSRPVPIPPELLAILDAQPKRAIQIFTTQTGAPITRDRLRIDWQNFRELHNWPQSLRLQDLRGLFISLLLADGADLRLTMELARHSNPTTTLKAYARSTNERQQSAVNTLFQSLKPKPSSSQNK